MLFQVAKHIKAFFRALVGRELHQSFFVSFLVVTSTILSHHERLVAKRVGALSRSVSIANFIWRTHPPSERVHACDVDVVHLRAYHLWGALKSFIVNR